MGLTHYDEPRTLESDPQAESLELLQDRRTATTGHDLDVDPSELPGFQELDEEMTAVVVPMQGDEFRCSACFLVLHRTLQAASGSTLCRDCASS